MDVKIFFAPPPEERDRCRVLYVASPGRPPQTEFWPLLHSGPRRGFFGIRAVVNRQICGQKTEFQQWPDSVCSVSKRMQIT